MKRILFSCLALALSVTAAQAEQRVVHVFTWDTYMTPALFKKFEAETGIRVVASEYADNDEMMKELRSGKRYDVVMPSGNYVSSLEAGLLLTPLPPHIRALGDTLVKSMSKPDYDPSHSYALPFLYGTTAIARNAAINMPRITSWQQFFTPVKDMRVFNMLDDIGTVMDVVSIAVGAPLCDSEKSTHTKIERLLRKQMPSVRGYDATDYFDRLVSGKFVYHMAWSGDVYKARQQNPNIEYIYPVEGVELWVDNLAIPATVGDVEAAGQFIAFALKPENQAAFAVETGYIPAAAGAFAKLPPAMQSAPELRLPPDVPARMSASCSPDVIATYYAMWERLAKRTQGQ
jgi:spermidine/putrescine transport system substrate-binding protein